MTLCLVSAVPLIVVGAVALYSLRRAAGGELEATLEQRAQLASVALERWIEAQRQPLNTIAAHQAAGLARPAEYFRLMVQTRPHWVDLRVIDAAGRELAAWPEGAPPMPEPMAAAVAADLLRRKSWQITTDWTAEASGGAPTLIFAMPIETGGAVVLRTRGDAMREVFREVELPAGAVLYVSDQEGRILYHSSDARELVGADITASPLYNALGGKRTALVETVSPLDGVRRVYGLAAAGETGCLVKIGLPSETLYRPARAQFARYVLYSLLALACALVAALFISRRISRPVRELRNRAHRLGATGAQVRSDRRGRGEVAELEEAFDLMARRIFEREENLQELNTRLSRMNEIKSEVVSGVSHELRTPLTTIKMLSRLMLRDELSEAERRESLEVIAMECDRQIDLVLNLLDLSRIEAGRGLDYRVKRVDILEVLHVCARVERQAANLRGHELLVRLPASLPQVRTDRRAVRRVLCSVIENAIKYTPDGGRVTLSARAAGEDVFIDVSDTGPGIYEKDYPYVFDKFWRGERPPIAVGAGDEGGALAAASSSFVPEVPGVGLGLYLARTILEQLGGGIGFVSRVGRGSTFTVRLPRWRGEAEGLFEEAFEGGEEHDAAPAVGR